MTQTDKPATGNASAHKLQESVGEYVKKNYGGLGVSIYGVSALDGYHSMLLTYRIKNGVHEFSLIDQGPATSILTGKSTFNTAQAFDTALSEYVRDKQGKRTAADINTLPTFRFIKYTRGKPNNVQVIHNPWCAVHRRFTGLDYYIFRVKSLVHC